MTTGLFLYRSNNVNWLGLVYTELIKRHIKYDDNPFNTIDTMIGTPAMGKWLEKNILSGCGIVAHHRFIFPRDGILERLRKIVFSQQKSLVKSDPWVPEQLCWTISRLLEEHLHHDDFIPVLQHLIPVAGDQPVGSKSWLQLVLKLTNLFVNYLWYRPNWILDWEDGGQLGAKHTAQNWQPKLWRLINNYIHSHSPDALHFPALLKRASQSPAVPLTPLYIFGVTRFPPDLLNSLKVLSKSCAIHLFVLNPSNQYWADLHQINPNGTQIDSLNEQQLQHLYTEALMVKEHSHPLLLLWGGQGRTNLYLMESLLDGHQKEDHHLFHHPTKAQRLLDRSNGGHTALQMLKQDLCTLTPPPTDPLERQVLLPDDDSIQLHNCHNLNRQLETLRDTLYRLFDNHKSIEPKDVLVLSPRYEEVVNLVPAVFTVSNTNNSEDGSPPAIPYNRIDVPLSSLNPIAEALLEILQLTKSRLDHPSVMAFLGKPVLRKRFKLSVDHIEQLKTWVQQAHIRWGADDADREYNNQPPFSKYTWNEGLKKMVLGLAMMTEDDTPFGLKPLATIEGSDGQVLLRGVEGIQGILHFIHLCREACSSEEWRYRLQSIITHLMDPEHDWQQRVVLSKLESVLPNSSTDLWTNEAISVLLTERFSAQKSERAPQQNAITFGSLYPERNLPYKVIALVGMDDGVFPGSRHREGIDLMHQKPLPGDPHRAHEDRYLLLEELLCAEEHLLVFYTGRDDRTNKTMPAAPPIQELKDVLVQSFVSEVKNDILHPFERPHPLHPFGLKAFQPNEHRELASYTQSMFPTPRERDEATILHEETVLAAPPKTLQLNLSELCRFLVHPIRYRHQKVHSLKLSSWTDTIDTREPFSEPKEALKRAMALEIVKGLSHGTPDENIKKMMMANFVLPLGVPSTEIVLSHFSKVKKRYEAKRANTKSPLAIPRLPQLRTRHTLQFDGHPELSFSLPPIEETMIFFQSASSREKADQLAWFEYYCGVALGVITDQRAISLSLYKEGVLGTKIISLNNEEMPENAQDIAQKLILHQLNIFKKGMQGQLYAFPKTGMALVKKATDKSGWTREELIEPPHHRKEDYQSLIDKLYNIWKAHGVDSKSSGDLDCPHLTFQFPDPPPLSENGLLNPKIVHDSFDIWGAPLGLPVGLK